ncbi:MAG: hypothetical protein ABR578_14520 [Chromatocurvus sp.]
MVHRDNSHSGHCISLALTLLLVACGGGGSVGPDAVLAGLPADGRVVDDNGNPLPEFVSITSDSVWRTAIEGNGQLRRLRS